MHIYLRAALLLFGATLAGYFRASISCVEDTVARGLPPTGLLPQRRVQQTARMQDTTRDKQIVLVLCGVSMPETKKRKCSVMSSVEGGKR